MFLIVFGALVLAQAVQQANLYWSSGPQVKAQVWALEQSTKALEEQYAAAGLEMPALTELAESKQLLAETQGIYLQTAVIDAILGVILLFLGVLYYPDEKHKAY
jgi:hypothetical protein